LLFSCHTGSSATRRSSAPIEIDRDMRARAHECFRLDKLIRNQFSRLTLWLAS
jgi:hypothetical protein